MRKQHKLSLTERFFLFYSVNTGQVCVCPTYLTLINLQATLGKDPNLGDADRAPENLTHSC